jgi:hypothetical protein
MAKLQKLTDKHRFLLAIEKAAASYERMRGDAQWKQDQLDELARSAAIDPELSYDGFEVDPAIVTAIRFTADPKRTPEEQKRAREDAWTKYSMRK